VVFIFVLSLSGTVSVTRVFSSPWCDGRARSLATAAIPPERRHKQPLMAAERDRIPDIEKRSGDDVWAIMNARFEKYESVRKTFVIHLFNTATTTVHLDHAMEAFYYSQSKLIELNEATIWAIQNACVRAGEPRRALELYANVHKFRIWPTNRHFNRLMQHFLEQGDTKSALETYKVLQARAAKPNGTTFGLLIRTYLKAGDTEKAVKAAEKARQSLEKLTPFLSGALMELHWKAKNIDALKSLVAENQANSMPRSAQSALYEALAQLRSSDVAGAIGVVQPTLSQKESKDYNAWADTLAKEAIAADLTKPAAELLSAIKSSSPAESHAHFDELIAKLESATTPVESSEEKEGAPAA